MTSTWQSGGTSRTKGVGRCRFLFELAKGAEKVIKSGAL